MRSVLSKEVSATTNFFLYSASGLFLQLFNTGIAVFVPLSLLKNEVPPAAGLLAAL